MISRKNITAEGNRDNNEHEKFSIILHGLEDNNFAFDEGEPVAADIIAVRRGKTSQISLGKWSSSSQPEEH